MATKQRATDVKGTHKLNPTKMIMKQGSREARAAHARSAGAKKTVTRPVKGKTK